MTLHTVRVPPEMAAVFSAAETVVARYFSQRVNNPERGTIEISGERYILVRAASLSVEFFGLVRKLYGDDREREADEFARNILFDLAHTIGKSDAHNFHARMDLHDPIARLSAGPIHFAYSGWAFVDINGDSNPQPDESFFLVFDHPYSFEASAWLDAKRTSAFPACVMNAGYSSGWCAESFGIDLVASEISCRARGDEVCRFVMAPPSRIETVIERYRPKQPDSAPGLAPQIPDLFARKRIEEELRRSHAELDARVKERTAELERANALLKEQMAHREAAERRLAQAQKLEAVGRLAGGVAHDFNNLLGVVLGRSSMVQSRLAPGDPLWDEMEVIRVACRQGASLTRHMIAFSRGQPAEARPIDLTALVRTFSGGILPLVGEDIEIVVNLAEDVVIRADHAQLEQVLINLVVNARNAMPAGGTLEIRLAHLVTDELSTATATLPAGGYAMLSVRDTGIGMDAETQTRIFEPFFSTKTSAEGTGLGLSTVYGIVQQAGGGVAVRSAPGAGTTLTLYFPLCDEPAERAVEPERPRSTPVRGSARILVVEDRAELRDTIELGLLAAGYQVVAAGDPLMALALVEKGDLELDVLLTDISMPKLGGRELAARIATARPHARVLYMSGYAGENEASADNLTPLLRKPFSIAELTRRIEELLNRS